MRYDIDYIPDKEDNYKWVVLELDNVLGPLAVAFFLEEVHAKLFLDLIE